MTIEDIKSNPVLFERKYRRANDRIAELNARLQTKTNTIIELRAQLNEAKRKIRLIEMKETVKRKRGEGVAFRNKMQEIFNFIEPYYPETTLQGILKEGRKRECAEARHLMIYFMRNKYGFSWKVLGNLMGGRDHSSAISSYNRIEDMAAIYKPFRQMVEEIQSKIK